MAKLRAPTIVPELGDGGGDGRRFADDAIICLDDIHGATMSS